MPAKKAKTLLKYALEEVEALRGVWYFSGTPVMESQVGVSLHGDTSKSERDAAPQSLG
jgi:hypothetical protein